MKTAAALWVLITVTNTGAVHQESGFHSRAVCEDAISIAKTGKTVAEEQEAERWVTYDYGQSTEIKFARCLPDPDGGQR